MNSPLENCFLPPCKASLTPSGSVNWKQYAPQIKSPMEENTLAFLKSGYDDFFADVGMVKTAAGFYFQSYSD